MLIYKLPVDAGTIDPEDNWTAQIEYDYRTRRILSIINLNTGEDMIKWYSANGGEERLYAAINAFIDKIESGEYGCVINSNNFDNRPIVRNTITKRIQNEN